MKTFLQLNDIDCYKRSFNLSNYVWNLVINWKYFEKTTVGDQFVTAIDSISANIAEGFGRYGKKDKIKFYYYSLGSLKESLDWNQKCLVRDLIKKEEHEFILLELKELTIEIYQLIKYTNLRLKE